MERLSWAIVIGFHLVWGLARLAYFRLAFILGAYSFKGLKGKPCMFIRDPLLGRLLHFNFCIPSTMRLLNVCFDFQFLSSCFLLTFLATCFTCAARSWKPPQGNIVQKIPICITAVDFPFWSQLLKSQKLRPVHQWVYYKLLAADLCLASMFRELNWKMPWGGRLAISSGSILYLFPFFLHSCLSWLRDI